MACVLRNFRDGHPDPWGTWHTPKPNRKNAFSKHPFSELKKFSESKIDPNRSQALKFRRPFDPCQTITCCGLRFYCKNVASYSGSKLVWETSERVRIPKVFLRLIQFAPKSVAQTIGRGKSVIDSTALRTALITMPTSTVPNDCPNLRPTTTGLPS